MPDAATDLRMIEKVELDAEERQLVLTSQAPNTGDLRLKAPTKMEEENMPQWQRVLDASIKRFKNGSCLRSHHLPQLSLTDPKDEKIEYIERRLDTTFRPQGESAETLSGSREALEIE